jgi:nicotinamidase-related amidase
MVFDMTNDLLPFPLTPRTVHLCVDMQRIFSSEGPWATPWMERVLPVVLAIGQRFPERTVFTRFITPQHAEDMPGTWRLYYEKWRQTTREQLDVRLLQLMPDLAKLAPPCHRNRQDEVFRFFRALSAATSSRATGRRPYRHWF